MRPIPLALCLLLLAGGFASAGQVGRDIRFVSAPSAEVRAKPSDKPEFYVTNRLARGTPVEVVGEEPDGWLAIKAPEGSFSYINTRFIEQPAAGMTIRVVIENAVVPVFVGSEVLTSRPTVIGSNLERGTQVISLGGPISEPDGTTYLRIRPPDRERRYIRAVFVSQTPTDGTAHSTFSPTGGKLVASTSPSANPGSSPGDLVRRAREAELAGQIAEAIKLYTQAATDTATTHPAFSASAMRYAQWLQNEARRSVPVVPVSRATVALGSPAAPGTAAAVPAVPAPSTFVPAPNMPPPRVGNAQWLAYRGVLRRSGHSTVGVQLYTLDDPITLAPLIEISPVRGMNLDAYLTRTVTLYGWTWYRGDLRRNFMQASQLRAE